VDESDRYMLRSAHLCTRDWQVVGKGVSTEERSAHAGVGRRSDYANAITSTSTHMHSEFLQGVVKAASVRLRP